MDLAETRLRPFLDKAWPITHFLGHRRQPPPEEQDDKEAHQGHQSKHREVLERVERALRVTVGTFVGLSLVALTSRTRLFRSHAPQGPTVIGSFGAEVIVLFSNPKNPFAQPRTAILGNTLSAAIGMGISKLYLHSPHFSYSSPDGIAWAAGPSSCALAALVMEVLGVPHPPGGATALLAPTLMPVRAMSWWYVVLVLVDTLILLGVALIVNNLGHSSYPAYWIRPCKAKQ